MSWAELEDWWLRERLSDSAYDQVVVPLLFRVFKPTPGERYLDLGCGNGTVSSYVATKARVVGVDMAESLARHSAEPVVVGDATALPVRDDSFDGVFSVLLVEHVADASRLFSEAARPVKPHGVFAIVSNHPMWTAPDSTPVQDPDGETLWRPGRYFAGGSTDVEVEGGVVTFHHRSMSELLNAATDAGWSLERMIEQPHHEVEEQAGIPRLIACRWRLLP